MPRGVRRSVHVRRTRAPTTLKAAFTLQLLPCSCYLAVVQSLIRAPLSLGSRDMVDPFEQGNAGSVAYVKHQLATCSAPL